MFESVFDLLSEAPLAYLVLFVVAAGDAILPALPSESAVILAGVLSAAESNLVIGWVVVAAAAGAFVGDNTSYAIGRTGGRLVCPWLTGPRRQATVQWARQELDRRGGLIVVVARFIPGGRTAATLTAGLTRFAYGRFAAFAALAAVSWALYAGLLGYLGGRVFHDRVWLAVLVAFALAAVLALAVELIRRARRR
jgi:membrane protein DedA with SNARE-associated domain